MQVSSSVLSPLPSVAGEEYNLYLNDVRLEFEYVAEMYKAAGKGKMAVLIIATTPEQKLFAEALQSLAVVTNDPLESDDEFEAHIMFLRHLRKEAVTNAAAQA